MSKRKGHPHKWCAPERVEWLPERAVIRTKHKITIPYNPLILQRNPKRPKTELKASANIYLTAERYQRLLRLGVAKNRSELAKTEGVSRARITQILNLLKLAPEIKEYLRNLGTEYELRFYTERRLREIAAIENHEAQRQRFSHLSKSIKKLD